MEILRILFRRLCANFAVRCYEVRTRACESDPACGRAQRSAEGTNARSLRFRFKTFELDWETPRIFAVSPLSPLLQPFKTFAASHLETNVVLTSESRPLQLPSRNYFRSLVPSAVPCRIQTPSHPPVRAQTCWLCVGQRLAFLYLEIYTKRFRCTRARFLSRNVITLDVLIDNW